MNTDPTTSEHTSPLKQRILSWLEQCEVPFQHLTHAAASTCEASASERGEPLKIGGKTLLFKDKRGFRLFTLPADRAVDSNKVRKALRSDKLRFASETELKQLTGAERGALPPFGEPLLPLPLFLDQSILTNDRIAFNCGVLTESVILTMPDYLSLVQPTMVDVIKE